MIELTHITCTFFISSRYFTKILSVYYTDAHLTSRLAVTAFYDSVTEGLIHTQTQ